MFKQINHIWWSNFPTENANFNIMEMFLKTVSVLSKLSMEIMQSIVIAGKWKLHFTKNKNKNIEVWTSDSLPHQCGTDNIQTFS